MTETRCCILLCILSFTQTKTDKILTLLYLFNFHLVLMIVSILTSRFTSTLTASVIIFALLRIRLLALNNKSIIILKLVQRLDLSLKPVLLKALLKSLLFD